MPMFASRGAYVGKPLHLRTGRGEADVTLALGECDENASGPGVSCVAAIKRNPNAAPLDRVIALPSLHPANGLPPTTDFRARCLLTINAPIVRWSLKEEAPFPQGLGSPWRQLGTPLRKVASDLSHPDLTARA